LSRHRDIEETNGIGRRGGMNNRRRGRRRKRDEG
jgi:hypothetical protein